VETDRAILVYTTFPTFDDAKRTGEALVAAKLAACVNIFPHMLAIFHWEGKLEHAPEVAMIVKTRAGLADTVMAETRKLHPYSTPALLVLPVEGGSSDYLSWIRAETGAGQG
jgi:periplasmic divalent cation tolerance protein